MTRGLKLGVLTKHDLAGWILSLRFLLIWSSFALRLRIPFLNEFRSVVNPSHPLLLLNSLKTILRMAHKLMSISGKEV